MKKPLFVLFLFLIYCSSSFAQQYSRYFTDKACRIDFYLCGNATNTTAYIDKIKQEPFWGGRRSHLSNDMNLGQYRFQVLDSVSNKLIYTEGFSALYFEWQSTPEALLVNKCFEQSIQFPYPEKSVKVIIEKRLDFDKWETLLQFGVSPDDKLIERNKALKIPVKEIMKNALPENAVDIAVIADGYTIENQDKFFKDAQQLAENLLSHEPFTKYKDRINIYAIATPSENSGISIPEENDWKNTAVSSHFYTFYEPRYLTTSSIFKLFDFAALVPYDAIYVLANTSTYGGGGFYNLYALATADCKKAQKEVVVHEFGHSFAGLGDEYFQEDADVLDKMYVSKIEPWEPNITSLVHFDQKWKSLLPEGTPIPTPVNHNTKKEIGVFEGGAYLTKGIYRPSYDCRMRTNDAKAFCPICEKAVEKRILFLTTPNP